VKGILADVNCGRHVRVLLRLFGQKERIELWNHLSLVVSSIAELGLQPEAPDIDVWLKCQEQQLILLTGNRNAEGADSLEVTRRTLSKPNSLPVFTIADPDRIMEDRAYAERTADKFLQYLFDIENYRDASRVYIP
jgi:hypothetical protein